MFHKIEPLFLSFYEAKMQWTHSLWPLFTHFCCIFSVLLFHQSDGSSATEEAHLSRGEAAGLLVGIPVTCRSPESSCQEKPNNTATIVVSALNHVAFPRYKLKSPHSSPELIQELLNSCFFSMKRLWVVLRPLAVVWESIPIEAKSRKALHVRVKCLALIPRDYQVKWVNPSYRPFIQSNPS